MLVVGLLIAVTSLVVIVCALLIITISEALQCWSYLTARLFDFVPLMLTLLGLGLLLAVIGVMLHHL